MKIVLKNKALKPRKDNQQVSFTFKWKQRETPNSKPDILYRYLQ